MKLEAIRFPRAHELAVESTIDIIERSGARAGSRLPTEAELAASFGLSRPTVREALRVLRNAGTISIRKGKGGGVFLETDLSPLFVLSNYRHQPAEVHEILVARRSVEGAIARLATRLANRSDFDAIERTIELMMRNSSDFDSVMRADAMFHRAIHRAAHCATLERAMREVRRSLDVIRQAYATPRTAPELTVDLCVRQLEAMRRRDLDAVEQVFDRHMRILEEDFSRKTSAGWKANGKGSHAPAKRAKSKDIAGRPW